MLAYLLLTTPAQAQFHHLLDSAKANPAATNWTALRAAYAASPAYDPFIGSTPAAAAIATDIARGDLKSAASSADQQTVQHWMDLRAQSLAATAYQQSNMPARAAPHRAAANGMLHAILATGNGVAPDSAYHVLGTAEESVLLQSENLHPRGQALVRRNNHWYDVVNVKHSPDGKISDVYFNVDVPFARETEIVSGHAKPVTDDQLDK